MDSQLIAFCRCCLNQSDDLKNMNTEEINLLNNTTKFISMYESYLLCCGLSFDEFALTKNICQICADNLKSAYSFYVLCRKSNDVLRENYGGLPAIKAEIDDENDDTSTGIMYDEASKRFKFTQVYLSAPSAEVVPLTGKNDSDSDSVADCKDDLTKDECKPVRKTKEGKRKRKAIKIETTENITPYDVDDFVKNWEQAEFICFFCDHISSSYVQYLDHRKTKHVFEVGMCNVDRMCNVCNVQTTGYVSHLKVEHPNYRPNRCKICQQSFNTQIRLVKHLYFHVDVDFKCLGCDFSSKNQKELRAHIANTQHSNNYHCPSCGMGFPNFNAVLDHAKDLHNQEHLYPCVKCKVVSLTKPDYDTHKCGQPMISQAEFDEINKNQQHTCEQCSQVFSVKDHYDIHFLTSCVETFSCEICVKVFKTRKQLYHHNRLHQERNYQCDHCGFRTTIESALKKHKVMHFDDRPHNCQKCSSAFKRKSELVRHQETHNEELFECTFCEKKFRSSLGIKTHLATHIPELKKFACEVCGRKFTSNHDKNRHEKTHEGPVKRKSVPPPIQKEHPCSICGKLFYSTRDKNRHIKIHAKKPVKCTLCPADFYSSNLLSTHFKEEHGANSYYECKFCGRLLGDASKTKKHMYTHEEFDKPYRCKENECSYDTVSRNRFKNHLLRFHKTEYDNAIHGYTEVPYLNDVIAECLKVQFPGDSNITILDDPDDLSDNFSQ